MRTIIRGALAGSGVGVALGLPLGSLLGVLARAPDGLLILGTTVYVAGTCGVIGALAGLGEAIRGATAVLLTAIEKQRPQASQ
jgi:hypothetical protein